MPKGVFVRTEAHKRNISKALKGRKHSQESIEKMRGPRPNVTGELNHFYGKTHTEDVIEYLRDINTGKTLSEDHKRKIGDSLKGQKRQPLSKETRRKIGKSRFRGGSDIYWATKLKKIWNDCSLCHSDYKIEMHHKDKDRKNHERSNLIILCETCHKFWHHT